MSLKITLKNLLGKVKQNIGLKIISLIIAIVLWFYLKNLITSFYEFYIPINYENMPSGSVILNAYSLPNYVLVKIKGDKKRISEFLNLPKNSVYAVVDLSRPIARNKYKVELFYPYKDTKIFMEYFPNEIFVDMDYLTNISVPVRILNSYDYIAIPSNVSVTLPSRNASSVRSLDISVDTNLLVYEISLVNDSLIKYYPDKIILSNTNR